MSHIRILKIQSKYRNRRWDITTVPEIRLEGKWLEELGFLEGEQIHIEQHYQKLTITLKHELKQEPSKKLRSKENGK
ncbi:SymE family type I addiction module toxin [Roseivirga sp.]|uniref:SymE family type I addiction module toxin n=1 Tax=Roseivirga sp. TaxID=1964215 RepID=UPI003B52E6B3